MPHNVTLLTAPCWRGNQTRFFRASSRNQTTWLTPCPQHPGHPGARNSSHPTTRGVGDPWLERRLRNTSPDDVWPLLHECSGFHIPNFEEVDVHMGRRAHASSSATLTSNATTAEHDSGPLPTTGGSEAWGNISCRQSVLPLHRLL